MSQSVPPWVYPAWDSLYFLDLVDNFCSHVREVFSYYLFKYFLRSFSLSSPSGTPIMRILVCLMLSQGSLRLSSFLFIPFSIFCSVAVIFHLYPFIHYMFLILYLLSPLFFIHSSASVVLLLIPLSVLFSSVCPLVLLGLW